MNIFGNLKESIPAALRLKAAQHVGETPEKTQKALDGLFPTVAGGLLKRASTETGLDQLYRTLQKPDSDKHLLDNLASVLDSPERTSQLLTHGNGLVSQLLPDKKSSIATMISTYAKVRNSSATSLLGLTMPLVLAALRREVADRNLDVQGLGSLLADQREAWLTTVPDGLADKLFEVIGIDNWQGMEAALRTSGAAVQRRVASAAIPKVPAPTKTAIAPVVEELEEEASGVNWSRWLLPAVALAVLGGGVYWYLNRPPAESIPETDPLVAEQSVPVSDTLARADSASRQGSKPVAVDSVKTTAPVAPASTVGFAKQLETYLNDPAAKSGQTFKLDGINFVNATSILTPESAPAVESLAKVMKDHPRLQIKLVGYTTEGEALESKKLAAKRANTVKSRLIVAGINFIRIDAAGVGASGGANRVDAYVIQR